MPKVQKQLPRNRLARVAQHALTAREILRSHAQQGDLPLVISQVREPLDEDYTQIDQRLSLADDLQLATLSTGLGYAGLTPGQRRQFLQWLDEPTTSAPPLFQQLYLAYLEVALLEGPAYATAARQELQELASAAPWQEHEGLARATLLGFWLAQDGAGLARWLIETRVTPAPLLGVALGWQALLKQPLQVAQAGLLLDRWGITTLAPNDAVLLLRLHSLTTYLGTEPLAHALSCVGAAAQQVQPWRASHRDLRLALPQPDLRPVLEPLLRDLAEGLDQANALLPERHTAAEEDAEPTQAEDLGWHLVLEFGQSRSELFAFALTIAQRLPGFSQILDENRKLIYRVLFKKSEMRQFWRLWDYVQGWSSTSVYLNGAEVEKWKVYPYSQFLR